jgi:hypothetical protein
MRRLPRAKHCASSTARTPPRRHLMAALGSLRALCAGCVIAAALLTASPLRAEPIPIWSPSTAATAASSSISLRPGDPDARALRARLLRAVFRAEAQHIPAAPYRPDPVRYDGAVVAVIDPTTGEILLLSAAAWLAQAQEVALLTREGRFPLRVERIDHALDLALLSPIDGLPPWVEPVSLIALSPRSPLPSLLFALLSPQHPYEQFVSAHILGQGIAADRYYLLTDLAATSGYPVFSPDGHLVAIQSRRPLASSSIPARAGLAIAPDFIRLFLRPD